MLPFINELNTFLRYTDKNQCTYDFHYNLNKRKCQINKITVLLSDISRHLFRSSRSKMFFKRGVLENFPNFKRKRLFWVNRSATLSKTNSADLFTTVHIRNNRSLMYYKVGILKHFGKFVGKHLCLMESLFNQNFIKKRLKHRCFPVKFAKSLRKAFFKEHFRTTILKMSLRNTYFLYCRTFDNGCSEVNKNRNLYLSLCKKCPYSELFWSVFSPSAVKCGPE